MTRGKTICGVLKDIRKQVADANEIKYEPKECHHQGECRGTCPACEAEVRYIEQQLNIRRQLGKAVAIVGISAGLSALASCGVESPASEKAHPAAFEFLRAGQTPKLTVSRDTSALFGVVEQMPEFPGGQKKLMEYLSQNVRYPKGCEHIRGRVIVMFVIEKDGSIGTVKVVKSVNPLLDEEAVRVVKGMPKWCPGKQWGEAVKVKYTIPVTFKK